MALPVISIESAEAVENNYLEFTVTLSAAATGPVSFSWQTVANGSATDVIDFYHSNGVVTFNAGETTKTIQVLARSDILSEFDENFSVELFNPDNAVFANGEQRIFANGTILDDDGPANVSLFVSDPQIREGQSGQKLAVFDVHLSRPASSDIMLDYRTADGSAVAGDDYKAKSGSLFFAAGETDKHVSVPVFGDTVIEPNEFFSLIVNPTNAIDNGTADNVGIATIVDNDPAASALPVISVQGGAVPENNYLYYTITLSKPSTGPVSIAWQTVADGSAQEVVDYYQSSGTVNFSAGETTKTFSVLARSDTLSEFDENFSVELFNAKGGTLAGGVERMKTTGVILDDDSPTRVSLFVSDPIVQEGQAGSKQAVFEVRLSHPSSSDITLHYHTKNGSALAGQDYKSMSGDLTFAAGETVKTVSVAVLGDKFAEFDEHFSLIVNPTTAIDNGTADNVGVATIKDNDPASSALPVVSVESSGVVENNYISFTATLSNPSTGPVSVDWQTIDDGSATDGVDYYNSSGTINFATGETTKTFSVLARNDALVEFDENLSVEISNPVNAIIAGGEGQLRATGVIFDDDGPKQISMFVSDPRIHEGQDGHQQMVFEVRLSRPAATAIALKYATNDGTAVAGDDYVAKSGTLHFAPGETVTYVSVAVNGDRYDESNETFSLIVTPKAVIANGTADNVGIATIINDDPADEVIKGTKNDDDIYAGGGDDKIYGRAGNDKIDGADGNDRLYGGGGSDILRGGRGDDLIFGQNGNDKLFGGKANDTLNGGRGSDELTGGGGTDRFDFRNALGPGNVDHITDFNAAADTIGLENKIFGGTGSGGTLAAAKFHIGSLATQDASDRITYDDATGALYYDSDGSGANAAIKFADLDPGLALTNVDFFVI